MESPMMIQTCMLVAVIYYPWHIELLADVVQFSSARPACSDWPMRITSIKSISQVPRNLQFPDQVQCQGKM